MKSRKIYITKRSFHLAEELKRYSWKLGPDGRPSSDDPVNLFDDGICAARYAIHTHYRMPRIYRLPPKNLGFGGVPYPL